MLNLAAVFSLTLLLWHGALAVAIDCSYQAGDTWANYGDREDTILECDDQSFGSYSWWRRDTKASGGLRDSCQLYEDEWQPFQACSGEYCNVGVDSSTVSLEYCCTDGANPADTEHLKCFTLTVCPLVKSVGFSRRGLFAGTQVSLYLNLALDPTLPLDPENPATSFRHPSFTYLSSPEKSYRILPLQTITSHTEFLHTTLAYTFTVPDQGEVEVNLNTLYVNGSECADSLGDIDPRIISLEVLQGDIVWSSPAHSPSPSPPSPSPSPTQSPTLPDTHTDIPHSEIANTDNIVPSCSSLADPTPLDMPFPSTQSTRGCSDTLDTGILFIVMVVVVVLLILLCAVLFMALLRSRRQKSSIPSWKESLDSESTDVASDNKPGFFNPLPSSSPLPPPLASPPPPPPSISSSLPHVISAIHEPSSELGAMVTAPPTSHSETALYSTVTGTRPHVTSTARSPTRGRPCVRNPQCRCMTLYHSGTGGSCHSCRDHSGTDGVYHSCRDHSGTDGVCHSCRELLNHDGTDVLCHSCREALDHSGTDGLCHSCREALDHSGTDHIGRDRDTESCQYLFIKGIMYKRQEMPHLDSRFNIDSPSEV